MICIDNKVIVKEEIKNINNKRKWTEKLIHRPCPLCGQSNYVIISRKMKDGINLPTVICKNCTLVYTNPIPVEEIYNRFYLEAYNDFYIHQDKFIPSSKVVPGDVNEILKIIQSHLTDNKSRILEIGLGSGRLLYYLSEKYANVQGIEPGSNAKYAREILNLNIIEDFFESHEFGDEKFDLIVMVHVLEHFYNLKRTILKCHELLSNDGYLLIELPNILKPYRSLDHYFLRYVHPVNFSPFTIKSFLSINGFSIVFEDSKGVKGFGPKNIRVMAVKQSGTGFSPSTGDSDYKDIIRQLRIKRFEWIVYGWFHFWLLRSMKLLKLKIARSKAGMIIKRILR